MKFPLCPLALALLAAASLQAQMPGGRPIPAVLVDQVSSGTDLIARRSIGHVEAISAIYVRTAVEGYLKQIKVEDGNFVNKGDVLFSIDNTRYDAAVKKAEANLADLEASLSYALSLQTRLGQLSKIQATSVERNETALSSIAQLNANKVELQALLAKAKKDLADCTIHAEISGQIGRIKTSPGNYILRGQELADIRQISPIYVRFPLSQSDVMLSFKGPKKIGESSNIKLKTPDGRYYPHSGQIEIVDNELSQSSDSYSLWAAFDNTDGQLSPQGIGAIYVSLKDNIKVQQVPITAVHYNSNGAFVYIIDENNKVITRAVEAGSVQGRYQSIYHGLKEGETVIIDGAHKTRVGAVVNPIQSKNKQGQPSNYISMQESIALEVTAGSVTSCTDPSVLSSHGARVEAIHSVQLNPQVQGLLERVLFEEGASVTAGDTLFEIDATRYQATYDAQKARVTQLDIKIKDAKSKLERQNYLFDRQASSKDEQEEAQSTLNKLHAQKASAEAQLIIAQDDLARCAIKAPMNGRIGRLDITEGNFITDSKALANLVQMSPIYVRFSLSERDILAQYGSAAKVQEMASISVISSTGKIIPMEGSIAFYDNHIQKLTDTQNFWAVFKNKREFLRPGGVVSIQVSRSPNFKVLAVPAAAIQHDSLGQFVYSIKDGKARECRILTGAQTTEGRVVVFSGINANDRVITNKLAEVHDGRLVKVAQ